MNWLAHLYLSDPAPAHRVGNLLPDFLSINEVRALPEIFLAGVEQHRGIDAFTDAHPVVRRSLARFQPPLRRFAGLIVDLFYDHFLARDWSQYSAEPLPAFADSVNRAFLHHRPQLPPMACEAFEQMHAQGWLCSYRVTDGIHLALRRISRRFRRQVDLVPAFAVLEREYAGFEADFREFFPQLRRYVAELHEN